MVDIKDSELYSNILKLLEVKTLILKMSIPNIELEDVVSYFIKFKIRNNNILTLKDAADIILSISENKIIEYLNIQATTNRNIKLEDFKSLL